MTLTTINLTWHVHHDKDGVSEYAVPVGDVLLNGILLSIVAIRIRPERLAVLKSMHPDLLPVKLDGLQGTWHVAVHPVMRAERADDYFSGPKE